MPSSNTQVYAGLSARALRSVPLSALAPLTLRQAEVLGWIAAGKRNREIAELLGCSVRTVEKHVENIMNAALFEQLIEALRGLKALDSSPNFIFTKEAIVPANA
jgi:DNA-binding CsgD family transcriptional regulator